jgi:iron(III) transport system ATP-binding protein
MSAVRVRGLTHGYLGTGGFRLGPLDLELPQGRRTALIGPSGSGKTTLLRILAGLEQPTGGTVEIGGRTVNDPRTLVPAERRGVGLVFQNLALWPHMTALQQVRFATRDDQRARALLARVGLAGKERRRPGELSGGEGQRLAIARALAPGPSLLLLDEPLRSVDPVLQEDLLGLLRELSADRGVTMLMVTHDRDEALAFGESLLFLQDGQRIDEGTPEELRRGATAAFTRRFLRIAETGAMS